MTMANLLALSPRARRRRPPPPMAATTLLFALYMIDFVPVARAQAATASVEDTSCDDGCVAISCVSTWWHSTGATTLAAASVLVFFATFLPRVLVRLVIFVLTKLPFLRQYVRMIMMK